MGFVFLASFTTWAWFAFRAQTFGAANHRRYQAAVYSTVIRGNPIELAVVAEELLHSTAELVRHATNRSRFHRDIDDAQGPSPVEISANTVLSLMANAKFCRAIVDGSPGTAATLLGEVSRQERYGVPFQSFARNFIGIAVANEESFLYQEQDALDAGALGLHRPVTQAVFSDSRLFREYSSLSFPKFDSADHWTAAQWKALVSAITLTVEDYVGTYWGQWQMPFGGVIEKLEWVQVGLSKTDGSSMAAWNSEEAQKLRMTIEFYKDVVKILDKHFHKLWFNVRAKDFHDESMFDRLAALLFHCVIQAGGIRSDIDYCWTIQHNTVWGEIDGYSLADSASHRVVMQKLTRLVYEALGEMTTFTNYKGARVLAFMLNVVGFQKTTDRRESLLQRITLDWMRRNYPELHATNRSMAETCLVEAVTYDATTNELVKQFRGAMGRGPTFHRISIQ